MNHRIHICLLAAATLAACGQPPSPGTPRALPEAEVTTTATTPTTAEAVTPTPPPPKPPPRTTTKTTVKPPPPPPKRPNRLVVTDDLRKSIEQRTGQLFPEVWAGMQSQLNGLCPAKKPCVGHTLVVDASTDETRDCIVVGIKMPDPLYEGGKITFRVTSTLCPKG